MHYVNSNFVPHDLLLEVQRFCDRHGRKYCCAFQAACQRSFSWLTACSRCNNRQIDNASNVVSGMKAFVDTDRMPCFAHTLQLVIRDVTSETPWCTLLQNLQRVQRDLKLYDVLRASFEQRCQGLGLAYCGFPITVIT